MTLFTNFLVLSTEAALCSCVTDFRVEDERMMPYYCTLVRGGQYFFFVCICWNLALEFYTSIIKIAIAFAFVSLFVSDIKCSYKKFSVWFTWGVVWASKRGEGAKIGLLIGINTHWMRFVRLLEQLPYPTTIVPEFHLFGIGHIFTPGFFFSPLSFFFASSSQNFKKRKKKGFRSSLERVFVLLLFGWHSTFRSICGGSGRTQHHTTRNSPWCKSLASLFDSPTTEERSLGKFSW